MSRIKELEDLLSKINTYYAECIAEREDLRDENFKLKEELREYKFLTEELQTALRNDRELYMSKK